MRDLVQHVVCMTADNAMLSSPDISGLPLLPPSAETHPCGAMTAPQILLRDSYTMSSSKVEQSSAERFPELHRNKSPSHVSKTTSNRVDPITRACQNTILECFRSTSVVTASRYGAYRQRVRERADYKWYMQFLHDGLVIEVDLPFQMFLARVKYCNDAENSEMVLMYLFEECLVLAIDANEVDLVECGTEQGEVAEGMASTIDQGLAVVAESTVWFSDVALVSTKHETSLAITQRAKNPYVTFTFGQTGPREKVVEAISPWLQDRRGRSRSCHCGSRGRYTNAQMMDRLVQNSTAEPNGRSTRTHVEVRGKSREFTPFSYDSTVKSLNDNELNALSAFLEKSAPRPMLRFSPLSQTVDGEDMVESPHIVRRQHSSFRQPQRQAQS